MGTVKLNVLLAKTDHLATVFKKGIEEYIKFFKGSQGSFHGEKKTYEARPGTVDQPSKKGTKLVVATVSEKLDYLVENSKEYIDALFAQEKTNASGVATARLIVGNVDFGMLTSLELLRLKSLLEQGSLKEMYENIPVRSDAEIWNKTENEMYAGRAVYESPQMKGTEITTEKESYILQDPNISKVDGAKYTPQLAVKTTTVELGDYTYQRFTGEMSHTERAYILNRKSKLLTAVIQALKVANDVEAIRSEVTAGKLFNYLHYGK